MNTITLARPRDGGYSLDTDDGQRCLSITLTRTDLLCLQEAMQTFSSNVQISRVCIRIGTEADWDG